MRRLLLAAFMAAGLVFGACNTEQGINAPVAPERTQNFITNAENLNLNAAQAGEVIEMFYLGEDMSAIMPSDQVSRFDNFVNGSMPGMTQGDRPDPRLFLDMEAMMYFRLALQANSDISDAQKQAFKDAIAAANQARLAVLQDATLTKEEKLAKLKDIHDALMQKIKTEILTSDQVAKTDALIAKIEAERIAYHEKMVALRIQMQITMWDRILKLDDTQKSAIKDILVQQDKDIQALRDLYKNDPEKFRQAVLDLQKKNNDAIRTLLNDAQKVIWDKMHSIGGRGGRGGMGGGMHG